jgi:hypothetical protein
MEENRLAESGQEGDVNPLEIGFTNMERAKKKKEAPRFGGTCNFPHAWLPKKNAPPLPSPEQ